MSHRSDILIVGGGVIGSACAYYLTQRGVSVTLVEKGRIGFGCSYGNAGWIVPSHGMPLPMPGALRQAARWMMSPDSPLYIKPRLSWEMAGWLLRFLSFASERHLRYAAPVLVGLAKHSLQLFEKFAATHGADSIAFEQRGLVYACNSQRGLAGTLHEMEIANRLGVPGRRLDAAELRELQPALTGPVVGGVYYKSEAHAEPLKVVQTLAEAAERQGATVLPHTEVFDVECNGRRVEGLRTTRGRLVADQYVFAAGSWTPRLLRPLRLNTPIQAGKGYALILEPFSPAPVIPMALVEKKISVTPRQGSIRLGGTMELAGLDESITPRRVDAIIRGAREFLNLPEPLRVIETWRGLRPCTPDGIPIIGRPDSWRNVILASGHAMLGLTLSAGTGHLVADVCTDQTPAVDPAPFRPSRF